jgi:crotonobetainyl-CoA:carnitine CoA-transferase CaiB-like acyl-CoA transferase
MAGPLDGLRVVELGWGSPASIAGMLFSDYGAQVIKAERPGGGPDRGAVTRRAWDRGKWSVEMDFRTDRDTLLALLERADVLIDSLGRGQAARHGLGYDELHERFPALVYCSITGYGQRSPWIDRPGYDALVAARLGQMAEQAGPPGGRDGPKFLGHASIAYGTAFVATIGALAALHARHETGRGQLVDASLLDGVLAQSPMNWWWNEKELSYLARSGNEQGFGRGRLITDLFVCQDDEWMIVHTGGAGGFKRAMDLWGFGDRIRSVDGALEMSVPLDDDEYDVARNLVPEAMKTRPRAEWVELFHAADIAAIPVLRPGEILLEDQVQFADVVVELPDPEAGTLRAAGPVIKFGTSVAAKPGPAPTVGQHNDKLTEVLAAAPVTTSSNAAPGAPAGPPGPARQALADVRILDFSGFFATAYGMKLLADLGADVIKVEPIVGDQMRPLPDPFEACQRGKRDIGIDLKSPAAREVIADLVRSADVVVHNLRVGNAEKLGITYDDLRAIKPDLIYCYLPGFGSEGPMSHLKSFAPLLSGFTGLLWEGAGIGAARPVRRVMGNEDYNNGFLGAMAVLMALEHRAKTGEGQYIESPQLHSSLLVTTEQCLDAEGNLVSGLMVDPEQMGWGPLYRLYRTRDGWICITCVGDKAWGRLRDALAPLDVDDDLSYDGAVSLEQGDRVIKILESRLAQLGTDEAFRLLDGNGVPCEIPLDHPHMPDFLWDEWAYDTGRVLDQQHTQYGFIRELGFPIQLSDSPQVNRGPGPLLGEHTVEVLTEIGYDEGHIDELLAAGTCVVAPPPEEEEA